MKRLYKMNQRTQDAMMTLYEMTVFGGGRLSDDHMNALRMKVSGAVNYVKRHPGKNVYFYGIRAGLAYNPVSYIRFSEKHHATYFFRIKYYSADKFRIYTRNESYPVYKESNEHIIKRDLSRVISDNIKDYLIYLVNNEMYNCDPVTNPAPKWFN